MFKLLAANFRRLKINLLFIFFSAMTFISVFLLTGPARDSVMGGWGDIETLMPLLAVIPAVLNTIFVGLFIGREYSDKAIRNKLIVGHTRTAVYLSQLITVLAVTVLWVLLWFLGGITGGLIKGDELNMNSLLLMGGVTLFYNCAFAAGLACVSMLVSSRVLAIVIHTQVPQYLLLYVLMYGGVLEVGGLEEPTASIVKAAINVLPMGQWFYCSVPTSFLADEPILMLLSAAVIAVVTVIGVIFYKHKELK